MRGSRRLEATLWSREPPWGAVRGTLLPLSWTYAAVVALRNRLYDVGWLAGRRPPIPVVGVGNLTVGGTGKTPVAAWIARQLRGAGLVTTVVARGYGRDELLLIERWLGRGSVVADADRYAAVVRAAEAGAQAVVLDDGFQHRRVRRDLDLVLVAADDPVPAVLLPAGPYRERLSAVRRADLVLLTSKAVDPRRAERVERALTAFDTPVVHVALNADGWCDLSGAPASAPTGPDVFAVSSIARPDSFTRLLEAAGLANVVGLAFPDHHEYTESDIGRIATEARGRVVVTTEKDAVKLEAFSARLPETRVLRMTPSLGAGAERLEAALATLAGRARAPSSHEREGP